MVYLRMLPRPGTKLDLTQLHNVVHNLVLSRREGTGFWSGSFESAWAGYIFANHSSSNQDRDILNYIKGELLGEKKPIKIASATELASYYMISSFLKALNADELAIEYLNLADGSLEQIAGNIDLNERFHVLSTPEHLYALVLSHYIASRPIPGKIKTIVENVLLRIQEAGWFQKKYIFALACEANLMIVDYSEAKCIEIGNWLQSNLIFDQIDENSLSMVWFLEHNWEKMRVKIEEKDRKIIDGSFILLRANLFNSLGQFDYQLAWCPPTEVDYSEPISTPEIILSTIELLMLDEVAEKHSQVSMVLTKDEIEQHRLPANIFDLYKTKVDDRLSELGLNHTLDAIFRGLASDNPASWQQAILGCRNLFYDLSKILWKIPGEKYAIEGVIKPLDVGEGKEKNRLTAYLHYKGISKNKEPIFMAQFEALNNLMVAFIDKAAKGKNSISHDEAITLLVAMYVLLGEMLALTGLEPATV